MMLKAATVRKIATPGKTTSHQAYSMYCFGDGEDAAPRRGRQRDAEAEERERRLGEDRVGHAEARRDQHRRERVRQQVAEDDARVARAAGARRVRELHLADAQELAADVARLGGPRRQAEGDHDRPDRRAEKAPRSPGRERATGSRARSRSGARRPVGRRRRSSRRSRRRTSRRCSAIAVASKPTVSDTRAP